jgi:chromosome segregation ATPase
MAINAADIHAAADTLAAQGKKPTLAAIRNALGGGSFSTIGEVMQTWKKQESPPAPAAQAPQVIADRAAEMAAQIWAVAHDLAEQRMQAERHELEIRRQELEAQRAEAMELADVLAAELDTTRAQVNQARTELEDLRKDAAVQAEKLDSLKGRAERAEHQSEAARSAETAAREEAAELRGKLAATGSRAEPSQVE